jgi:uncharacterized protein with von Willebrand factor type A (vWA) domain
VEARIIEFAGLLRRNGIRVSTAETLDALRAVETCGLGRREVVRSALRATMVKRAPDIGPFNQLFDLYFSGLGDMLGEFGGQAASGMSPVDFQALLDRLSELIDRMDPGLTDLARALALDDSGELERLLRELMDKAAMPASGAPTQAPGAMRALMAILGAGGLAEEFDRLREAARLAGMSADEQDTLGRYLEQRLADLGNMLKGLLKLDQDQRERKEEREQLRDRLFDKSFYYLSASEIREMRDAVAALARRLKNLMSIRRRHKKRGRLDVKATLRASMEFGGVPFRIRFEDKRKERPQVVILCDISDSVRNVSRFMLQFVHSLQDLYSRVRSYVFVADIAEVTRLFKENDIQTAINDAIGGGVVNVYAHSDFGRAFKAFHRDHLEAVDSRTTVIILGDARNNYNPPNDWVLRDVQQRARQVIWLNPENGSTWGFGDSEMAKYARYCDVVEECRNLRQLYKVVDRLVLA